MSGSTERLYHLLPALYRIADQEQGEPLRALMGVLEAAVQALEADISQLYDNWFIETCEEWAAPYLGDLVGLRALLSVDPRVLSMRAYAANTLTYRRRKGTPGALEQVARDVTGWPAHVHEYFQQVLTAQHCNNLRMASLRSPHLRWQALEPPPGSPFEKMTRTADVRQPDSGGRHNLPNLLVFLWRLRAFVSPLTRATAVDGAQETVPAPGTGFYRVSPLGQDLPLFNRPQTRVDPEAMTQEVHLPVRLRRAGLYQHQRSIEEAGEGAAEQTEWFGPGRAIEVHYVHPDGSLFVVPAGGILIADLSTWRHPTAPENALTFVRTETVNETPTQVHYPRVALDPVTGRLALPSSTQLEGVANLQWPTAIYTRYSYGSVGELGGGPYDRRSTLTPTGTRRVYAIPGAFASLEAALFQWNQDGFPDALIEIGDSDFHAPHPLSVPANGKLELRALNQEQPTLDPARMAAPATRWEITLEAGASLVMDGLRLLGGPLVVQGSGNGQRTLRLQHCTLVPGHRLHPDGTPAPVAGESADPPRSLQVLDGLECAVSMSRCITGSLELPSDEGTLNLEDSIIDGLIPDGAFEAVEARAIVSAHAVTLRQCTVLGQAEVHRLELASNCLLVGALTVARRQEGCIRYSYAHEGSVLPRQYQCPPTTEGREEAGRLRPRFTSLRYGQPGYGQLSPRCAEELRKGAEDEGELGALHFLQQPAREANLRATLDEYLNVGLEAGVFFVT